jgi:prepilin-type N-terminal cleavage/methylation domain-containing protein
MNNVRSHGFTLLEVLLALALTALILVALGMAIDFHFRVLDAGRAHVEEGQLARVLLHRIADDLRGAVYVEAASTSDAATTTAAAAASTDISLSNVVHTTPGIYGDAYSIQVDVSRLPQPHPLQTQSQTTSQSQPASLSDVKTVSYFTGGAQGSGGSSLPVASSDQRGLMRCEMDRAVALYQAEHGGLASTNVNATLLAPEVAGLQFAYSDGSQWLDSWDSSQNGGLPMAVRVTVYIIPNKSKRSGSQWSGGIAGGSSTPEGALTYYLLVSIPIAQPTQTSGTSTDSGTSSGTNSGTSSGGS